jgi:hypothetical protein
MINLKKKMKGREEKGRGRKKSEGKENDFLPGV